VTFPSSGIAVYAPTFTVKLEGKEIPTDDITSIEVDEQIENPGSVTISFNDMLDMKTQKFRWLDDTRIHLGTLIEVSFSYAASSGKNILSFTGRIESVSKQFNSSGNTTLDIMGFDLSHDMMKSYKGNGVYNDKKYSQIVEEIASAYGMETDQIKQTKIEYELVSKELSEDDYQFIKRLAKKEGLEFFLRGKSLYFRKPDDAGTEFITFTNGINIVHFSPRISISTFVNEVEFYYYIGSGKEKILQVATLDDITQNVYIPDYLKSQNNKKMFRKVQKVKSSEEAKSLSIAELESKNQKLITANLECIGNPSLRPGITIKIEKVGNLFSGTYYVEKAKHSMKQKGYSTTLTLRRCK